MSFLDMSGALVTNVFRLDGRTFLQGVWSQDHDIEGLGRNLAVLAVFRRTFNLDMVFMINLLAIWIWVYMGPA